MRLGQDFLGLEVNQADTICWCQGEASQAPLPSLEARKPLSPKPSPEGRLQHSQSGPETYPCVGSRALFGVRGCVKMCALLGVTGQREGHTACATQERGVRPMVGRDHGGRASGPRRLSSGLQQPLTGLTA